jgi:tRNA(Ile)-lysidine synthase
MRDLLENVGQSIRERKLLRHGESILVAVSGGLDSMVLLHLLHGLAPQFGWRLCVAHFNHQLRGRASDADERFVRTTAAALDLPVRAGRGAVRAFAKQRSLSIEMAARGLRHQFLAQTARRLKCRAIAVAHHADDQVELFCLRLLRGAGGEGLAGMKWGTVSPADDGVRIIRPLLEVTRESLARFAREHGIRYREDASNASLDILRNRVRHELLPLLRRRYQPAIDRTILRTMDIVGADAEFANEAARAWLKLEPSSRRIADQPIGLQRRIIQLQLQKLNIEADFDLIETLRGSPGQPVTVAPGRRIQRDDAGRIFPVATTSNRFRRQREVVRLAGRSGLANFGGAKIKWRSLARRGDGLGRPRPGQEVFDADQIGSRIILRHWRAGDRFQPIGMTVAVKLQDWFTNRKVPAERRRELIVATTARGAVFWVEGQRIGERFKLTAGTRRRLIWRWVRAKTT